MLFQSVSWLEKSLFSPNSNKNLEVLILVLIYRILFNDFLPKKKEWGCTQILEKLNCKDRLGEQKLNNSRRTTSNSTNDDLFPNSFRENRNSELSQ